MDLIRALVDQAYAAALDDSLWKGWAAHVIERLGGNGGALSVINNRDGSLCKLVPLGWERVEAEYRSDWAEYDPLITAVSHARRPITFLDTDHVVLSRPETAAYMLWQRSEANFDHHMGAAAPLNSTLSVGLSIHRAKEDGHTPPNEFRALQTMFSQAASAMRLGFLHSEMLDEAFWEGLTTHSDAAAMLLDEDGHIIRLNDGAEAILARGDGLIAIEGRLESMLSSKRARLNKAISEATGKSGLSATVPIGRTSGRSAYIVIVYPLVWTRRSLAPSEAAALVRVIDPTGQASGNAMKLGQAFDLTAREAEFAALLLGGHSVESAAYTLGIAMPTARIYVRNLLAKTGTTSQAGFMRLASGLR